MPDLLERLKSALTDRYAIESEIGRGGMAVVFLAHDRKLNRQVALKVLRPELAASLGSERFLREIEIAANLSHPNILGVHDCGDADGLLYYVMPYVEGESLRERLDRDGKLPVAEVVRLADEIAAALTYAHERGIIHRDVKPGNVMLTGGRAVVADFGIARAVQVAGGEKITGTGLAIGTPAYMSPEQALGQANVDARSDVYSLGCVVYEMAAGTAPFEGATPQQLLARHAMDAVPGLRRGDSSIPLFLERAVERAMAKDPSDRFPSAREFAAALTDEIVVGRTGGRRHRRVAVAGTATVVIAAATWLLTTLGGSAYERLAVLPPSNLMNDPEQDYFVEGVHNALISELQRAGVVVIARTSVLRYRNTTEPIREIANELGVDALIEPTVLRSGDSVEIEVRLVDGRTEQYVIDPIVRRTDLRNVERLYRQLTGAVAAEIRAALGPEAEARLASARPVDPQAYEAYLKGQFHWYKLTPADLETALQYYEVALGHDPDYAPAYAGIALAWAGLQQMALASASEAEPKAREAARRALELDSAAVEVQYAWAIVSTWANWDWESGEAAFLRSIELNPSYPDGRAYYAHLLACLGRPDEALVQIERAVEIDPYNPLLQGLHGAVLYFARRYDEAVAEFQKVLRTVPNHPLAHSGLHLTYDAMGEFEEAEAAARSYYLAIGYPRAAEALARVSEGGGYRKAMRAAADALVAMSRDAWVPAVEVATLYTFAREDSLALDWLERAFGEHDPNMPYIGTMSAFDRFRDDPRFRDLLQRMNLAH